MILRVQRARWYPPLSTRSVNFNSLQLMLDSPRVFRLFTYQKFSLAAQAS